MDTKTFLDSFGPIAEAPGGVLRLRGLVLDLATSGRLVAQHPTDEPAAQLVGRIARDMSRAVEQGIARRNRVYSQKSPNHPWLPAGWCWSYIPQLGFVGPRNVADDSDSAGFVPMSLVPTDIRQSPSHEVRRWSDIRLGYTHVADGDVAIAKITPCFQNGKSAVFADLPSGIGAATTELFVVRPTLGGVNPRYIHVFLRSPAFISPGVREMTGTAGQQRLPREYFTDTPLPLPPLPEQERIVAKVDELMGLCDELEAHQQRRRRANGQFRSSALHALTEAEVQDDLHGAWERISINWRAVTEGAETASELRQTILQLALRGRLSPSQLDDEPAINLVQRSEEERAQLARDGLISGPNSRTPVPTKRVPFILPASWEWVHVEDVCTHVVDCLHRTPKYVQSGYPAIRTCDVEPGRLLLDQALRVDEQTYLERTSRLMPAAGDIFYSREGGRFGIAAIVPPETPVCLSQRMMHFRCSTGVDPNYFTWFLNSPLGFAQAQADVGGSASPHVNIRSIKKFVFPLPPEAEQRRIAARITELMSLCDALASTLASHDERLEALSRALTHVG